MKERQPDLFETDAESADGLELYTDGTWRRPGDQDSLGFAIPFAETRTMAQARRECDERSKKAVDGFAERFETPEKDTDSSADDPRDQRGQNNGN